MVFVLIFRDLLLQNLTVKISSMQSYANMLINLHVDTSLSQKICYPLKASKKKIV